MFLGGPLDGQSHDDASLSIWAHVEAPEPVLASWPPPEAPEWPESVSLVRHLYYLEEWRGPDNFKCWIYRHESQR